MRCVRRGPEQARRDPEKGPGADPAAAHHRDRRRDRREPGDPCDEAGRVVLGVGASAGIAEGRRQECETQRGQSDADPLTACHALAEQPVGGHRQQHQPAGDHRLHQRDRRQRKRGDVKAPRRRRDGEAEQVPARPKQGQRAAHRAPKLHRGRGDRPTVLVEEPEDRAERGGERQQQPELDREAHRIRLPASARQGRGYAAAGGGSSPEPSPDGELALDLLVELDRPDRVLVGKLLEHLVDDPQHLALVVAEVVEQRSQRGVGDLELRRGQLQVIVELGRLLRCPSPRRSRALPRRR